MQQVKDFIKKAREFEEMNNSLILFTDKGILYLSIRQKEFFPHFFIKRKEYNRISMYSSKKETIQLKELEIIEDLKETDFWNAEVKKMIRIRNYKVMKAIVLLQDSAERLKGII